VRGKADTDTRSENKNGEDLKKVKRRLFALSDLNKSLSEKNSALQKKETALDTEIATMREELAIVKDRNKEMVRSLELVETQNAIRVYNLTMTLEEVKVLQQEISTLKESKEELKLKLKDRMAAVTERAERCEEKINSFARVNGECREKIGDLNVCLREAEELKQRIAQVTEGGQSEVKRYRTDKIEKETLIKSMRADLESCLALVKSSEETPETEDCESPCTITRGSGAMKRVEGLETSKLVSDLTLHNLQLKQELSALKDACEDNITLKSTSNHISNDGKEHSKEESANASVDFSVRKTKKTTQPLIGSTTTNQNAGNTESSTNEKEVEDTIDHVVDILKSLVPKAKEEHIQTRMTARNTS